MCLCSQAYFLAFWCIVMRITKWHFPLNWNWQQWRLRMSFWLAARLPVDGFSCKLIPPLILCSPSLSQRTVMEWVTFFSHEKLHNSNNKSFVKAPFSTPKDTVQIYGLHSFMKICLKIWIIVYLNLIFCSWSCVIIMVVKKGAHCGMSCFECTYLPVLKFCLSAKVSQTVLKSFKKITISWCCTSLWRSLLIVGVLSRDECREQRRSCMFVWDGSFSALSHGALECFVFLETPLQRSVIILHLRGVIIVNKCFEQWKEYRHVLD